MILYLIGVDYKTESLPVREYAYRKRGDIVQALEGEGLDTKALFTCNRVEIYGVAADHSDIKKAIVLLRSKFPVIFSKAYIKVGRQDILRHAVFLAIGLESQITGEFQILEQLHRWLDQGGISWQLRELWHKALSVAKKIRSQSGLSEVSSNIGKLVFKDLFERRGYIREIVIVGTGKVAQLIARDRPGDVKLNFIARKRHTRARQLVRLSGGDAFLFDDLERLALNADVIISATASPHQVIKKKNLTSISKRKNRLFIYDLAMPRDVSCKVSESANIELLTIDDLEEHIEQYKINIKENIENAEKLAEETLQSIKEEKLCINA